MLGNVTVQQPRAWIVGLEGEDDEAVPWQKHDVAARRVVELEIEIAVVESLVLGLLEDGEVVAVKMHL